jgi:hypothetical protein
MNQYGYFEVSVTFRTKKGVSPFNSFDTSSTAFAKACKSDEVRAAIREALIKKMGLDLMAEMPGVQVVTAFTGFDGAPEK